LLARYRGVRHPHELPKLRIERIVVWIEQHYRRTGTWPSRESGAIAGVQETWSGVNTALARGRRGLRGKSSLARVVKKVRRKSASCDARMKR
jgi:hypothetical protein